MAAQFLLLLVLAMVGVSDGDWCVCKPDKSEKELQKTIDFACGANADCRPIHEGGSCYMPNNVVAHCSFATNSYYQRSGQSKDACNFTGIATLTSTDPSYSGCTYPSTPSAAAGTSAGTNSTPATNSSGAISSVPTTFSPTISAYGPSAYQNDTDGAIVPKSEMGLLVLTISISWMAFFS